MRLTAALILVVLPVAAMAQTSAMQGPSDAIAGQILDGLAKYRGQIMADQSTIATLNQQNGDLSKKSADQEKTIDNLQKQLKAATAPVPAPGK